MASPGEAVQCYACHGTFPVSQYPEEFTESGDRVCPGCGGDFVELVEARQPAAVRASGGKVDGSCMACGLAWRSGWGAGGAGGKTPHHDPRVALASPLHGCTTAVPGLWLSPSKTLPAAHAVQAGVAPELSPTAAARTGQRRGRHTARHRSYPPPTWGSAGARAGDVQQQSPPPASGFRG